MDEKRIAAIFKAFCDENRIRIIKLLRSGEKCACKLLEEINVTQPTLSHHMKILCDAEIVVGREITLNIRDNQNQNAEQYHNFYSIIDEKLNTSSYFARGI